MTFWEMLRPKAPETEQERRDMLRYYRHVQRMQAEWFDSFTQASYRALVRSNNNRERPDDEPDGDDYADRAEWKAAHGRSANP
jgi:hypothetical protein